MKTDLLPGPCVHEWFAQRATEFPRNMAVSSTGRNLTYQELEESSNRLANFLRERGVGPDVCVGLLAERSPEMVLGALGILKAGGAYLPLDPSYPRERLNFILRDAGVQILLTASAASTSAPTGNWTAISLDAGTGGWASSSAETPMSGVSPVNLAYVIYTSGSTGQPKGVEISHASLLNLVLWHHAEFGLSAEDRATLVGSPGFDAAVWEIWPYLTAGASLHLPAEAVRVSPELLRDWLVEQRISISFVPTAIAERLIQLPWPQTASLRFLLTGADTLHRRPASGLPFRLINNYGPTECTVVATSGEVRPENVAKTMPSIGRPIANIDAFILNERLQPVGEGDSGELCIGGAGLARGYRGRPDLTAERFVEASINGAAKRIYRTGDRARFLPDGEIEFLGRLDDQVKVRGYRIEPREIVEALNRNPKIRESAVIARDESSGDKRLVAYYVAAPGANLSDAALAEFLRVSLPEYTVPSAFVAMDSLPVTAHGKIDRDALPDPDARRVQAESEYIAPRTAVEERIAEILASLMGLRRVSVHENFFLLGGHSLLGTQVIARIRDAFAVELPLRSLFDAPTVADLSSEVERLILRKIESTQPRPAGKH